MLSNLKLGAMPKRTTSEQMALKQKLTATEHQALGSDAERGYYKQAGADYVLDVEGIDNITSVVSTITAERTRANTAETNLKRFEGIDPEKWKQYVAAEQNSSVAKLADKGQYDQALATVTQTHEQKQQELQNKLAAQAIDHSLTLALSSAGVIPARLKDALQIARPLVGTNTDNSVGVLGADGKVDLTKDFTKWIGEEFKKDRAFLFAPNGNGGSGAPADTAANLQSGAVVKTRAEFNALSPQEKIDFSNLVGQKKAQITA